MYRNNLRVKDLSIIFIYDVEKCHFGILDLPFVYKKKNDNATHFLFTNLISINTV